VTDNLPPIQIWIFSITFGVSATAGVDLQGNLTAKGLQLTLEPSGTISAHLEGGVSIVVASGGVDVSIDLIEVSAPVTAQVTLQPDPTPAQCAMVVSSSLNAQVTIGSGGGEVDLVVTFGICPFCDTESWTLFSWGPLASFTTTLFDLPLTNGVAVPLAVSACTQPLNVTIISPTGTVFSGAPVNLAASFDGAPTGTVATTWTGFVAGDSPSGSNTTGTETFGPIGPRSLTVTMVDALTDRFGRTITDTGSASETIQVQQLQAGSYIIATNPAPINDVCAPSFGCTVIQRPFNNQSVTLQLFSFPALVTSTGEVLPSAANPAGPGQHRQQWKDRGHSDLPDPAGNQHLPAQPVGIRQSE